MSLKIRLKKLLAKMDTSILFAYIQKSITSLLLTSQSEL